MRIRFLVFIVFALVPSSCFATVVNRAEIAYQLGAAFSSSSNTVSGPNSASLPLTQVDGGLATASVQGEVNQTSVYTNVQKMSASANSTSSTDLPFAASARITESWRETANFHPFYANVGTIYALIQVHGVFRAFGAQPNNPLTSPDYPGNAAVSITVNGNASSTWTSVNGAVPTLQDSGWYASILIPNNDPYVREFAYGYLLPLPPSPSGTQRDFSLVAELRSTAQNGTSSGNLLGTIGVVDILDQNLQSIGDQVTFSSGLHLAAVPEADSFVLMAIAACLPFVTSAARRLARRA